MGIRVLAVKECFQKDGDAEFGFSLRHKKIFKRNKLFAETISRTDFHPRVESAPFYYWQGSPVESAALRQEKSARPQLEELRQRLRKRRNNLVMYNWHRHILALGLEKYSDYRDSPIIGNVPGLRQKLDPTAMWPLALLIAGIWLWFSKKKINNAQKIVAGLAIVTGCVFFCNNWPFFKLNFDQYHDSGNRPYQNYIDYVNDRGGLTFWAHPEAEANLNMAGVGFLTTEYSSVLAQTRDYAGFCVFPSGYQQVGRPKGLWDELLLEYCQGIRKRPVWAIAGLAFEKGDLRQAMKNRQTVIISAGKTKADVLQSLRNGKMYCVEGEHSLDFSLDKFYVTDSSGQTKGMVGDTVKINGKPLINISGRFGTRQESVEIKVMRNGRIFKRYILPVPFNIVCADEEAPDTNTKFYYRLEITSDTLRLITNPVFVERK